MGTDQLSGNARRHVLVLAPQPFYEDRGTPIALSHVLRAMVRSGIKVDVITYPVGRDPGLDGVRIYRAGPSYGIRRVPVGFSARKLLFDSALAVQAWRHAASGAYTAIYAIEEAIFPAVLLGRRLRLPVIYDMQSSMPEQLQRHRFLGSFAAQRTLVALERWLIRQTDVIACSAGLEDHVIAIKPDAILESWRYPGEVSSHAQEELRQCRKELDIPEDAPVVYYGGTFKPYQGIDVLLAAVPGVLARVPNAVFVFVGATDQEPARACLSAFAHARSFRLLPRLPRAAAARYLAVADVAVSPRCEGSNLPLKIVDYMAAAKPIVATDNSAHRSVLNESRALLVELDAASLAQGIVELLTDRARASELAQSARDYVESRFGREAFDAQVARLLEAVETGRAKPPQSERQIA